MGMRCRSSTLCLTLSLVLLVSFFHHVRCLWDLSEVLTSEHVESKPHVSAKKRDGASAQHTSGTGTGGLCFYHEHVSPVIQHLLCAVESGQWGISPQSRAMKEIACLIDQTANGDRCRGTRPIPTEEDTPASPPPPNARNKDYQRYAEKAEELVPRTWWRAGFASDALLLSHNDKELPRKTFDERSSVKNKKLKNLHQCVTRQAFIRQAYAFGSDMADSALDAESADISAEDLQAEVKVGGGGGGGGEEGGGGAGAKGRGKGKAKAKECSAAKEASIQAFRRLLQADPLWGGEYRPHARAPTAGKQQGQQGQHSSLDKSPANAALLRTAWVPSKRDDGRLFMAAHETLQWFYTHTGGIWTGCFALQESAYCRGALASAALVVASHLLVDIAGDASTAATGSSSSSSSSSGNNNNNNKLGVGASLVEGYMLASLGRGLLHGDTDTAGEAPSTAWRVRLLDCVALQQAFLKVYIDSFGAAYAQQLRQHVPMAFAPGIDMYTKRAWQHLNAEHEADPSRVPDLFEPVYSHLRNWMYVESGNLIDFGPYRPLVSIPEVNAALHADGRRRILVDVGANGFFASPKYLLDSYAPYLPFTDAIMIEPEPHFSASIPDVYSKRYNISHQKIYAEVNTGTDTDILKLLGTLVTPQDYVVLKFDVDPNKHAFGPTMEWGFLFDLARNPQVAELVDELYIELHFHYPALYWKHYHSNWEALDALRYLRSRGAVVHAWP
jgi:hypothetical protein